MGLPLTLAEMCDNYWLRLHQLSSICAHNPIPLPILWITDPCSIHARKGLPLLALIYTTSLFLDTRITK